MSTGQAPTTAAEYPDRSTLLLLAGIFQILLGCLAGLLAGMMAALLVLSPRLPGPNGQPMTASAMVQPLIVYLLLAAAFLWLGIGLVRARRWAWTLTVVFSWLGLVIGVISFVFFLLIMRSGAWESIAQQGKLPPEALRTMRIVLSTVLGCIYILLPAVFLLLCHHESVRATCLRRDPHVRWTDRCPMPVLALCVLLALSLVSLSSLVAYHCVVPLFGVVLSGTAGVAATVVLGLVLAYLVWGTYRLQRTAWWGLLLFGLAGTANMAVTFSRVDMMKLYERMGIPAEQLDLIRKMGVADMMSRWGPAMTVTGGIAWLGYLLFVRRYFVQKRGPAAA